MKTCFNRFFTMITQISYLKNNSSLSVDPFAFTHVFITQKRLNASDVILTSLFWEKFVEYHWIIIFFSLWCSSIQHISVFVLLWFDSYFRHDFNDFWWVRLMILTEIKMQFYENWTFFIFIFSDLPYVYKWKFYFLVIFYVMFSIFLCYEWMKRYRVYSIAWIKINLTFSFHVSWCCSIHSLFFLFVVFEWMHL